MKKTLDAIKEPNICAVARMLVGELQDITGGDEKMAGQGQTVERC